MEYESSPRQTAPFNATDLESVASSDQSQVRSRQDFQKHQQRKRPSKKIHISKRASIFIVSFCSFVVLWQAASDLAGNTAVLAGPVPVLDALLGMFTPSSAATLGLQSSFAALSETIEVVAIGLALSIAIGIPLGIAMGRWKNVETILEPLVSASNAVPIIVFIPALYFSIGGGLAADVFISFALSVFSVIINTHAGVRYTSNTLSEVGKTFGANEKQLVMKIVFPSSLPDIFAGIRIAIGRALLGAVMAEVLLGGNHGLGGLMITYEEILNTPSMMATIVLVTIVGIVLLQAPKLLERRMFRWRESDSISRELWL